MHPPLLVATDPDHYLVHDGRDKWALVRILEPAEGERLLAEHGERAKRIPDEMIREGGAR